MTDKVQSNDEMSRGSEESDVFRIPEYYWKERNVRQPAPLRDPLHRGYKHAAEEGVRRNADGQYVKETLTSIREANDYENQRDGDDWGVGTNTTRDNIQTRKERRLNEVIEKDFARQDGADPKEASIKDRMPVWEREAGERSGRWSDKGKSHRP